MAGADCTPCLPSSGDRVNSSRLRLSSRAEQESNRPLRQTPAAILVLESSLRLSAAAAAELDRSMKEASLRVVETIQVRPYPLARSFDTMEDAVAHALSHPRLSEARRDAARLRGSAFVDACWTLFEWVIRFDSDLSLCVWIDQSEVCWELRPSAAVKIGERYQR